MMNKVRVWDLPTRVFHWALALCAVGLAVTGLVGGNAMVWHFRLGYTVLCLLLFRIIWGLIGGRWSRFASFFYSPGSVVRYLRGQGHPDHSVGHNPLGAGSVFALLLFFALQVASGLMSDDEIAFSGPLAKFVSNSTVSLATKYHYVVGKWILLALVLLHIGAILYYLFKKKENLTKAMVVGDKELAVPTEGSRDTLATRLLAAVVLAICGAVAGWVASL